MMRLVSSLPGVVARNARMASTCDKRKLSLQRAVRDESGQALVMTVFLLILFLGLCAFSVDIGYAMLAKRELQASADAAALAAAQHLADGTWLSVGLTYSANAGSRNSYSGFTISTPSITARCSSWENQYVPCTTSQPNVVTVQETATVPTFFAWILGHRTLTVTAESAAAKGANPQPYNVAIILDTTGSMNTYDSNCGKTQLQCAESAIKVILAGATVNNVYHPGLDPGQDNVSLFTFPAMNASTADNDSNCSGQQPTGEPYTFPSTTATSMQTVPYGSSNPVQTTYQILGFNNNYRTSESATTINSSSPLAMAIGAKRHCSGIQVNTTQNTYLASTIYAAQSALLAEQTANPGTQNAIILLSDGNATAVNSPNNNPFHDMATSTQSSPGVNSSVDGKYPNLQGQCGQEVDAAAAASSAGTLMFTIAYGAPATSTSGGQYGNGGNCASDMGAGQHPNITPCQAMQQMSTGWNASPQDTSHFYSDYYGPNGDSNCQAANANNTTTSLDDIAASIVVQLERVRLVPPDVP